MTSAMLTSAARDFEGEFDVSDRILTDSDPPLVNLPGWFEPLVRQATRFLSYEQDWDSYGGKPIEQETFLSAMQLLGIMSIFEPGLPKPSVVPTSMGGIAFEWNTANALLEIEVNEANRGFLYFESHGGPEERESEFRTADLPLTYVRLLTQRTAG